MKKSKVVELSTQRQIQNSITDKCIFQVPYPIWQMIALCVIPCSFLRMSITCRGFNKMSREMNHIFCDMAKELWKKGQDYANVAVLFIKAAIGGNTEAMFHLSFAYSSGIWGLRMNDDIDNILKERAADLGNVDAMANMACISKHDRKDRIGANYWCQKIRSSPNPSFYAQALMGMASSDMDSEEIYNLFKLSADVDNNMYSQFLICHCGDNDNEVDKYMRKSAAQNFYEAQIEIDDPKGYQQLIFLF